MILVLIGEIIKMRSKFGGIGNEEETHTGRLEQDISFVIRYT